MISFIESIFSTPDSPSLIVNVGISLLIILVMSFISLDTIPKLAIKHDWNLKNLLLSVGIIALYPIMMSGIIPTMLFFIILIVFGGLGFNVDGAALEKELAEADTETSGTETSSFDLLEDPHDME